MASTTPAKDTTPGDDTPMTGVYPVIDYSPTGGTGPRVIRDAAGRFRVYDEATDRFGWADFTVTWEG
jgi:hypothetical protein